MKLNHISPVQAGEKIEQILGEVSSKNVASSLPPIKKPFGIKDEEYTDEYIEDLKDVRDRRPDLYKKIMAGL